MNKKVQIEYDYRKLKPIDRTKIEKDASSLPAQAKALRIMGEKSLEKANEFLKGIIDIKAKIDEAFDPIIKKAHAAHKEALGQKKKALEPVEEAEAYVRGKIREVLMQRERNWLLQRKAEEEARMEALLKQRKAEEEKQELEKKLEDPNAYVSADTIANLDFGAAHDKSSFEMNDYSYPVATGMPAAKVGGTSLKTQWKFRIIDKAKIPLEFLIVDEVKIGKVVRAAKGQISIPGIEVFEDKTLNVR